MRGIPDTPQDRPGDGYYFDRLQQFHKLNRQQSPRRALRNVILTALLICGLLVTVGSLWLTRSNSRNKGVSSEVVPTESHADDASTQGNGLVDAPSADAQQLSLESVWNRVRASIVQVRSDRGFGSGFVVGEDLVATNHHVVVASTGLRVYFQDGTSAEVEGFAAADVDRDLAVIRVATGERAKPLSLSRQPPSVGDPVAAVSFFERTGGQIASVPSADETFMTTTASSEHGYSGGPLVDGEGRVVGMVRGMSHDTLETLAIPAAHIRDLIRSSRDSHRSLPVPGAQIDVGWIYEHPEHGISVSHKGWALVTVSHRSSIQGCLGHGMYLRGDHHSVDVLGGILHENGGHGIFIRGDSNTLRISGGEISSNQGHGVLVEGDDNVISVSNCLIWNNNLRGLVVNGNRNKIEISGGTILGRNGADFWVIGRENTCVVTGGVFGDDGNGRDGQHRVIGHRAKRLHMQALVAAENGKADDAIRQLDEAVTLNPEFARAYSSRGSLYFMQGDYPRAVSDFDEAIRLNPQFALAYSNRGCAYRESGDLRQAVSDFTEAIRLNHAPDFVLERHRLRGTCLRRMGDHAGAIDDFVAAMRNQIEATEPYIWRNDYYSRVLTLLSDEIGRGGGVSQDYYSRGRIHFTRGHFEKAVDDCTRAIDLGGDSPVVYVLRALAYERMNDATQARADYAKARDLIEHAMERYDLSRPALD